MQIISIVDRKQIELLDRQPIEVKESETNRLRYLLNHVGKNQGKYRVSLNKGVFTFIRLPIAA